MSRPGILESYRTTMVDYLVRRFGITSDKASEMVTNIITKRYRPMTVIIEETLQDGVPQLKAVDLVGYLDKHRDDLISSSGSIYCQHEKKVGATIEMVLVKLALRGKLKKAQFHCKAIGDIVNELINYYGQTMTKVTVNSLPGNYGSPYSIFYSKGNYNAITSTGRSLIGYANTCIEHVLGGNFGWFSQEQLVNHIVIHLRHIDPARITEVMNRFHLKWVTHEELLVFFKESLSIYHRYENFNQVEEQVALLTKEEVQFFWYYQNLKHVIMYNDEVFRPWFDRIFNVNQIDMSGDNKPDELFKLDGALVQLVSVAFNDVVGSGNQKIQAYDLPKEMPDKAIKFVKIAKHLEKELSSLNDIFSTFIDTPLNVPDVLNRKMMYRKASVVSDTDSVIFTVKDWVEWYTHDVFKMTGGTYKIACTMIYWITQRLTHVLKMGSISHGARGSHQNDIVMKNEFFYPTMCLADVKKHYAGVITVQEGVVLAEPQTDIKGVQFKGSDKAKEATVFAENFIVNDILLNSLDKKISGRELIKKVMAFERKIYDDIHNGSTDWFEPLSIKDKSAYAKPLSSNYMCWLAYEEIFGSKYGHIEIPNKTIVVPLNDLSQDYIDWLKKKSPGIAKKLEAFLLKYKKLPGRICINPITGKVPEELIPLITIRDIIYNAVEPCRLILKQLGIDVGFKPDKPLFNEIYGEHSLLWINQERTKNE